MAIHTCCLHNLVTWNKKKKTEIDYHIDTKRYKEKMLNMERNNMKIKI